MAFKNETYLYLPRLSEAKSFRIRAMNSIIIFALKYDENWIYIYLVS